MKPAVVSPLIATVALLSGLWVSPAAATLLVDRGLPDTNLNNVAGANRSNVSWGFGATNDGYSYYSGDKLQLGSGQFRIDTLRTWVVMGSTEIDDPLLLQSRFASVALYGGVGGAPLTARKSGSTGPGNSTDNPDISVTSVTYSGNSFYQGSSGSLIRIFEVEFNNLNWVVDGSVDQYFSVVGLDNPNDNEFRPWFMHASNATLGGVPADGADNFYNWFFRDNATGAVELGGEIDSNGLGWDKSSDINVQVVGERIPAVPEPGTLALLAGCLLALGLQRRRA